MSQRVSAHIVLHKKNIRRSQLDSFFASKRCLFAELDINQAITKLMPHLEGLKDFAVYETSPDNMKHNLAMIKQILSKFNTLPYMVKNILQNSSRLFQMKFQQIYLTEMTWIDLVLEILKSFQQELEIAEECSSILSYCASSFKEKIEKKRYFQQQDTYERQWQRLFKNYPYDLILEGNLQTIKNSLSLVTEISQTKKNGSASYEMINRTPNIVTLLNELGKKRHLTDLSDLSYQLNNTAISVIYNISRYNYNKLVGQQLITLIQQTKENTMNRLTSCQTKQQFGRVCDHLNLLFQIRIGQFTQCQFYTLEQMLERQTMNKHLPFFKMFKNLLKQFTWVLQPESIKIILGQLFNVSQLEEQDIELKVYLVKIFNYHVINSGNYFRTQDIQIFTSFWGQYSKIDRLLLLLSQTDKYSTQQSGITKQVSNLIKKIVNGDKRIFDQLFIDVHQDEFTELVGYPEFMELFDPKGDL